MGKLDNLSDNPSDRIDTTENLLTEMIQEIDQQQQSLQSLIVQLQQEVERLQGKKSQLLQNLDQLEPSPLPTSIKPRPKFQLKGISKVQLGFFIVLIATAFFSFHNVVIWMIGSESKLPGFFLLGGYIKLGLGNSLLVLWLRVIVVLPLLAIFAKGIYPPVWQDFNQLFKSRNRHLLLNPIVSGFSLFLSQILIYIAIGQIGPGVAVTILFIYPIVTVPLANLLLKERLTVLRIIVLTGVVLGVILTALPRLSSTTSSVFWVGVSTAVVSGIALGFYLVFQQLSFKDICPVPITLIQFSTIFFLSSFVLMLPLPLGVEVMPLKQSGLFAGTIILGILTLLGYLLNTFGFAFMGATNGSIVSSSEPAMTALLAMLILPGPQTALKFVQIVGIVLVTLAVAALGFEKKLNPENRLEKVTS